ncbi:response regulator transcription factor [Nostoc sp. PCC 7107]|uniref:response regulator transcription factor n=1 Tax=Nostoc sp. PCC 7107 TaxID=317936 RepID=UPI00029F4345|nr:response regulator [Nostoc sp. PCC 7107]AFY44329.1 response regulator receiver protein [Nostoc sp. PCC 7107]
MQNILIVDDEIRIAAFIEKGLRKNGFNTAIANNGEQALEMLTTAKFDLLLLDVNLPVKDGLTVLTELRAHNMLIPTIIVSANHDVLKQIPQSANKTFPYISKPFKFTDLLNSIRTHLSKNN